MYIPKEGDIKEAILSEAHREHYCAHLRVNNMDADMKKLFFWPSIMRDVVLFVSKFLKCQQVTKDHGHPTDLLNPHDIPMTKWEVISMEFIVEFPLTYLRHNAILVVDDKLNKSAHFILDRDACYVMDVAKVFINEVICIHEVPKKIIFYRDTKFTSIFWTSMQPELGTQLNLSFAYHPDTYGQTERVNKVMG